MAKLLNINKDNKDVNTLYIIPENISDNVQGLLNNYLLPLPKDIRTKIVFVSVFVPKKGVLKKNILLEELEEVNKVLSVYDIKNIVVCNVNYYKFFLKANKKPEFERDIGSVKVIEYNSVKYNLTPQINHIVLNFQPNKKKLLDVGNNLIQELLQGTYVDNTKEYLANLDIRLLKDVKTVEAYLNKALNQPLLTCDIEATGLKWFEDDLLTISFSVNEKVGFSIPLHKVYTDAWSELRQIVKQFIIDYKGELVFHNASYDIPFLVYHLFMNDITDTKNMIYGINQFNVGDTMIMAWLCLNNVDKPKLGLKHLAYHKFGNWDDDINQSKLITYPFEKVGTYNTIDTFATLEIYNKYSKQLAEEGLEDLYNNFYKPFLKGLMKMKMNGITLNKQGFEELKDKFETMYDELYNELMSFEQVQETETILKYIELSKRNEKLKTKQLTIDEINFKFNPKSSNQVRILLFQVMGLPEQEKSKDTGQPKTDKDTINKLLTMLKDGSDEFRIVQILQEIGEMKTVKSTFVDGLLEQGVEDSNGNFKIFGNFNITGTVSGRLSSSAPNLQNIPSNSKYGKLIKQNLIANKGFIVAQADFAALEERIGANITQDPNKIKIFTEGFDSHSLATSYYFEEELKDRGIIIDKDDANSVNRIKTEAKDLRSASKPVTFSKNYGGTAYAISKSLNIPLDKAEHLSNQYDKMFEKTLEYRKQVEQFALDNGYVQGAFGLKLRADLSSIFDEAKYSSTLRTLVNMTIQSYAMLMNRTIFKLQEAIEEQGYEEDILIQNSVHDSIYLMVKPDAKIIEWLNKKLLEIMLWLPKESENWVVKNDADLELGKSWIAEVMLENNESKESIENKLKEILK